jgi:hypothetical protein
MPTVDLIGELFHLAPCFFILIGQLANWSIGQLSYLVFNTNE